MMNIKNLRSGLILILLAFAIAFSMIHVATPVSAGGCTSHPHGTTITVVQGGRFLLRYRLYYDEPGYDGMFMITLVWYNYENKPDENLTFLSARAYWDNGDNLQMDVTLDSTPSGANTMWMLSLDSSSYPTSIDNYFNVDIWMGACGVRGICHTDNSLRYGDNHPILGPGGLVAVSIAESTIKDIAGTEVPITIDVTTYTPGVILRAGPNAFENSQPATPPPYVVYGPGSNPPIAAVQRVGSGAVFAAGLTSDLDNNRWNFAPNPYDNTLDELLDAVFQWMVPGADNMLWFTGYGVFQKRTRTANIEDALIAKGYTVTESNLVDNDITVAKLSPYDILVIPGFQLGARWSGGDPSLLPDNNVEAIDNWVRAGGGLAIFNNADFSGYNYYRLHNKILKKLGFNWRFQSTSMYDNVDNWGAAAYYLKARVENTGPGGGYYQVTGYENIGIYSATSLVPVPTWSVSVSISPAENAGAPPITVNYTVTVTNTGTAWDNYDISVSGTDNVNFTRSLNKTRLYLAAGATDNSVAVQENILDNAPVCTWDNVTVTVTSTESLDPTIKGNAICRAHAIKAVDVSISPGYQSGLPGAIINYTVTVKNTGIPGRDNYNLTVGDNAGWGDNIWLDDNLLENIPQGENRTTTLHVRIPENTPSCTEDNIWVKATSQWDNTKSDNASCIAHALVTVIIRGVDVSISPDSQSGAPGSTLNYTVTVSNTGNVSDTYDLEASDGWPAQISPTSLTVAAGGSDTATLSVTIPSGTSGGASTTITVTATSRTDPGVSDSDNCDAVATAVKAPTKPPEVAPGVWPPPTPTGERVGPFVLMAIAVIIALLAAIFIIL